jgi:hypothetical protein
VKRNQKSIKGIRKHQYHNDFLLVWSYRADRLVGILYYHLRRLQGSEIGLATKKYPEIDILNPIGVLGWNHRCPQVGRGMGLGY